MVLLINILNFLILFKAVSGPSSERERNNGVISLKLWREGFTINDRELRSYHNPSNREFLAAIKRGEIPEEIRQEIQGAEVRLNMEDHHHEEYVPPKVKVKAFTGKGHMLGRFEQIRCFVFDFKYFNKNFALAHRQLPLV